jgi:nitrous oxidase accessory protein NosD
MMRSARQLADISKRVGFGAVLTVLTLVGLAAASPAEAAVRRVPRAYPTIQAAIDAANPGDVVEVGPGSYCGVTVDRPLTFIGRDQPAIVGCDGGPALGGGERIGFFLPGEGGTSAASGTRIDGFMFDGRGLSETNLQPIALGVLARFADDVRVQHNRFIGVSQAVTNTAGDRWVIADNRISDLTVFDCTGALCEGGDGIVVQIARGDLALPTGPGDPVNRPEHNVIADNRIDGTVPDGFDAFSLAGIFVFAADDTLVAGNRVAIPDNPNADAGGDGVLLSNECCGQPALVPGARRTVIVGTDGDRSQFGVVVEGTGGANTEGLVLFANSGTIMVEGNVVAQRPGRCRTRVSQRARHTLF